MPGRKGEARSQEVREKIQLGNKKYQAKAKIMREFYLKHQEKKNEK